LVFFGDRASELMKQETFSIAAYPLQSETLADRAIISRTAALLVNLACVAISANATTIISDAFSGINGAAIDGRTPDGTDLPGGTEYVTTAGNGVPIPVILTGSGNPAPTASTGFHSSASISIASTGTYVKPIQFVISADLCVNTITGSGTSEGRGVALGFYSVANPRASDDSTNFTGLVFGNNSGSGTLYLYIAGTGVVGSVTVLNGTLNTTSFYNVTYTVNTANGSLSNILFNGTAVVGLPATTAFTDAATSRAAFYGSSDSGGRTGYVDNFTVSTAVGAGLAGDYNHNGIVDAADYTVLRDGLGSTFTQADYDVWKSNFGAHAGSGSGATAAVPEPATLWMLLAGVLTLCYRRRATAL
jgi:hypothetical protein